MMIFELVASAQKGVVYLPVVSLSSYMPVVAQIVLMILVISLSGLFGAWLMFQRLAKKVLALESANQAAPVAVVSPVAKDTPVAAPFEVKPARVSGARARKKEKARLREAAKAEAADKRTMLLPTTAGDAATPKHKRTLFVSKSPQAAIAAAATAELKAPQTVAMSASGRLVLARPGRRPFKAPDTAGAAADDSRIAPQTFLVNDWFPMDK